MGQKFHPPPFLRLRSCIILVFPRYKIHGMEHASGSGVSVRVRAKISSQIFGVAAPGWQGAKVQEYQAYSELSQRSRAGCIGD